MSLTSFEEFSPVEKFYFEFDDFEKELFKEDVFYVLWIEDDFVKYKSIYDSINEILQDEFSIETDKIKWYLAKDSTTANDYIKAADKKKNPRRGYGFDIVICDLKFKKNEDLMSEEAILGFEVVKEIADKGWIAPIIGFSAYTLDSQVSGEKKELLLNQFNTEGQPVFADYLEKEMVTKPELFKAKLLPYLIPLFRYVAAAQKFGIPSYFIGNEMLKILRRLVEISLIRVNNTGETDPPRSIDHKIFWSKLPKILLFGDAGSGKSHLAYVYKQLLALRDNPKPSVPPDFVRRNQTRNCASLTANDQGGRAIFFGTRAGAERLNENRDRLIPPNKGLFELATYYTNPAHMTGFAEAGAQINYDQCGVVFLDEFATLDLTLQASILNAIEDGTITRVLTSELEDEIPIGCQIICATNVDPGVITNPTKIGNKNKRAPEIREDIVDRIPYILRMPSLRERDKSDIELMLRNFAAENAGKPVKITPSATEILHESIKEGLINSVRHLKTIANVQPGENFITDSNFRWIFEKARILGKKIEPNLNIRKAGSDVELTLAEKAKILLLSNKFQDNNLPEWTAWAINQVYDEVFNNTTTPKFSGKFFRNADGKERQWRYWLLSTYIDPELAKQAFRVSRINNQISKARNNFGFNDDGRSASDETKRDFDLSILLNPERCLVVGK